MLTLIQEGGWAMGIEPLLGVALKWFGSIESQVIY